MPLVDPAPDPTTTCVCASSRRDAPSGCIPPAVSEQDLLILRDLAAGLTLDAIAGRQHLSERSVRRHVRRACEAFGVETGIEAVVKAVRLGLI